jgi:hypothetical protein
LDFLFSFSFLFFWRAGGIEGSRVFFLFGYHLNVEESSSTGTLLHYYLDLYLFEGKKMEGDLTGNLKMGFLETL